MKLTTKGKQFRDIVLKRLDGREATIDEMVEIFEDEGFWTDDDLAEAEAQYKKVQIRAFARKRFVDDDGVLREIVNVKRDEATTTGRQQVFAFLDQIVKEDFERVIIDTIKTRDIYQEKIIRYLDFFEERFGKKARNLFQHRLNFEAN